MLAISAYNSKTSSVTPIFYHRIVISMIRRNFLQSLKNSAKGVQSHLQFSISCPLIVVLNILVMVSVKTKRQLRTKSNIALACLATTDLVVGQVLQPLHIAMESFLFKGEHNMFCTINDILNIVTLKCFLASFHHLVLMSAERYAAIKHPVAYETKVTKVSIIIISALAWAMAIIIPRENPFITEKLSKTMSVATKNKLLLTKFLLGPQKRYSGIRKLFIPLSS